MDEADLKGRLQRALEFGGQTHSMADLLMTLRRGEAHWFGNGEACVVAEIHTYPQAKYLNYWLVAGELRHCLQLQPQVDAFGLREGCTHATAMGRTGWQPSLAKFGWSVTGQRYVKVLQQ